MSAFQALKDEHHELWPSVEQLREIAAHAPTIPGETLKRELETALEFLSHHLIPHAHAEDAVLYPVVAALLGNYQATATMSRDHQEVKQLITRLAELATVGSLPQNLPLLQQTLYGLYALLKVHFAKEEEIYLPLLETNLTRDAAERTLAAMDAVAHYHP